MSVKETLREGKEIVKGAVVRTRDCTLIKNLCLGARLNFKKGLNSL
jgi:hypothetical protein